MGGALDTNGNSINDDSGDDKVVIDDDLDVQGNITLSGTVDGVDIAARDHAAPTDFYSQAVINQLLHIGTGNKGEIALILEGANNNDYGTPNASTYRNTGSGDFHFLFGCPLPLQLADGKHLHVDYLYLGVKDADANDYVTDVYIYGNTNYTSTTTLYSSGTNRTAAGLHSYATGTDDWGDYKRVVVDISIFASTTDQFDLNYVSVRYWYA